MNSTIRSQFNLSLPLTVRSHGWVGLRPWVWDEEDGVLSRPETLPSGRTGRVSVSQSGPRSLAVEVETGSPIDLDFARQAAERWLSTSWDPGPAIAVALQHNEAVADFIKDGGGRMLHCTTFYEDFAKTVCTIQIAWSGTMRMVAALIDEVGEGMFPTPAQVLDFGEKWLRERAKIGFRARTLYEATDRMLESGLLDNQGNGAVDRISYDDMIGLHGIGPYAAGHLMMLLHDYSRIPVDSEVESYCRETFGIEPKEIQAFFDRWGEYRFLGYKFDRAVERLNRTGD